MKECKWKDTFDGMCFKSGRTIQCKRPIDCGDYETEIVGMKNDVKDGKIRWELVPLDLIEWVAKVYTFGATKYKAYSWQHIGKTEDGTNEFQRYKAALLRHLVAHEKGEFLDPESGLPHLAHVLWNAIAMLYFGLKENEGK